MMAATQGVGSCPAACIAASVDLYNSSMLVFAGNPIAADRDYATAAAAALCIASGASIIRAHNVKAAADAAKVADALHSRSRQ